MLLNTNAVKKKQLIEKDEHSLLHFLHALLIIDHISFLSMGYCISQQQISRQLMVKIRFEHREIAKIRHPAHPWISKPRKQQKNIPIPNLIIR